MLYEALRRVNIIKSDILAIFVTNAPYDEGTLFTWSEGLVEFLSSNRSGGMEQEEYSIISQKHIETPRILESIKAKDPAAYAELFDDNLYRRAAYFGLLRASIR